MSEPQLPPQSTVEQREHFRAGYLTMLPPEQVVDAYRLIENRNFDSTAFPLGVKEVVGDYIVALGMRGSVAVTDETVELHKSYDTIIRAARAALVESIRPATSSDNEAAISAEFVLQGVALALGEGRLDRGPQAFDVGDKFEVAVNTAALTAGLNQPETNRLMTLATIQAKARVELNYGAALVEQGQLGNAVEDRDHINAAGQWLARSKTPLGRLQNATLKLFGRAPLISAETFQLSSPFEGGIVEPDSTVWRLDEAMVFGDEPPIQHDPIAHATWARETEIAELKDLTALDEKSHLDR